MGKFTGVYLDQRTGKHYAMVKRNGKLKRVPGSFDTPTEAAEARDAYIADRQVGRVTPKRTRVVPFDKAVEQFVATRLDIEQSSKTAYESHLKSAVAFFGDTPLQEISEADLSAYREYLSKPTKTRPRPCASSTVRTKFVILKLVYRYALQQGWLYETPFGDKLPKAKVDPNRHRALSVAEHNRLVAAADHEFKVMFQLWPDLGLRRAEMLGLRKSDIDFEAGVLRLNWQIVNRTGQFKPPKGGPRVIPLSDKNLKALRKWMMVAPPSPLDLVFPSPYRSTYGSWLRDCALNDAWRRATKRAHLTWAKAHNLRHTFGSWQLVANKGNLALVSRLMGHASVAITARVYIHDLTEIESRKAADNLEQWRRTQHQ